jgi:methylmalonyl-CoA mutase
MRLTAAGFAAAAGGADSLTPAPFTAAVGLPTPHAQRLSRNIQILLAEEAGVGRVGDPARGSFHHEALTRDLVRAAWAGFQEIAAAGGLARLIAEGRLRRVVDQAEAARAAALAGGEAVVVGVTKYVARDLPEAEVEAVDVDALRLAFPSPLSPPPQGGRGTPIADHLLLRPIRLAEPYERTGP